MKTATAHYSCFGSAGRSSKVTTDQDGYVTYHDSDKYEKMAEGHLRDIAHFHRFEACRNAAILELICRSNRRLLERSRATGLPF